MKVRRTRCEVRGARREALGPRPIAPDAIPAVSRFALRTSHFPPAFTLIEVMIAGGILFMCLFAILGVLASGLRSARALQDTKSDPRSSVASQVYFELSRTNSLTETAGSGEFADYRYDWEVREIETNGLCEVDIVVGPPSRVPASASTLQIVMYLPQMQRRPGGGAAR